jgi:hypothetical protein
MPRIGTVLISLCLLVVAGPLLAAGLPPTATDSAISGYEILLVLHLLLFVFWLGPDIGVFAWSRKVINPGLSDDQRLAAASVMHTIDLMPRVCLSLMLTVGGILTEGYGIEHPPWQWAGIILLGPVWLTLVLIAYFREGTHLGATVNRFDLWLRWTLVIGIIGSVLYSTSIGRLNQEPWIASKLLLFSALIFFGIMVRLRLRPFFTGLEKLSAEGSSESTNALMASAQRRAQPFIIAIWVCIALEAGLGVFQPGSKADDAAARSAAAETAILSLLLNQQPAAEQAMNPADTTNEAGPAPSGKNAASSDNDGAQIAIKLLLEEEKEEADDD